MARLLQINVLFILLILTTYKSNAQELTIKGKINHDEPIILTLKLHSDSTFIRTIFPDSINNFYFNKLVRGDYFLEVSTNWASVQTLRDHILINQKSPKITDLGDIKYDSKSYKLNEVVISGRKPIYQHEIGKFIFNVESSSMSIGNNTFDMLKRTPMVLVDLKDNLQVMGKNPVVYINGRKAQLQGAELLLYLKSIPAEQIARIEVMPIAPAKYDAQGSGGVINIQMKRSTQIGFNGNFSLNYQQYKYASYFPAVNINLNTKNARFFVSGSYNREENDDTSDRKTVYFLHDKNSEWNSKYRYKSENQWSYYLNGGTELFLNKKNTLYFETSYQQSETPSITTDNVTVFGQKTLKIDSTIHSVSNALNTSKIVSSDLSHTLQIPSIKGKLESGIGYFNYNANGNTYYNSDVLLPDETLFNSINYQLKTPNSSWGLNAKTDISGNWKEKLQFNAGGKYAYTESEYQQRLSFTENDTNNIPIGDTFNNFLYKEKIIASYIDIQYILNPKWTVKGGLRGEYTQYTSENKTAGYEQNKSYMNWFPTVFLQYAPSENHTIGVSWSKRIDRPYFSYLNPTRRYNNPYSYIEGNPDLKPETYTLFDLNYVLKNKYVVYMGYGESSSSIYQINLMDNTTMTKKLTYANLTSSKAVAVSLSIPLTLIKDWWDMNTNVAAQADKNSIPELGYTDNSWQTTLNINFNQSTKITKSGKTRAELNFFYASKHKYGVQTVGPTNNLDIAFTQQIMADRGTFKISFNNIINGKEGHKQWMESVSNTGTYYQMFRDYDFGFKISFRYRFAKGLKRNNNNNNRSSINEEQSKRTKY